MRTWNIISKRTNVRNDKVDADNAMSALRALRMRDKANPDLAHDDIEYIVTEETRLILNGKILDALLDVNATFGAKYGEYAIRGKNSNGKEWEITAKHRAEMPSGSIKAWMIDTKYFDSDDEAARYIYERTKELQETK